MYYDEPDPLMQELHRKSISVFDGNVPSFHIELFDKPTLVWDFHSLMLTIHIVLGLLLTDESKPLRSCFLPPFFLFIISYFLHDLIFSVYICIDNPIRIRHKLYIIDNSNNCEFSELPNIVNYLKESDSLDNDDTENYIDKFSYRNINKNMFSMENSKNFFQNIKNSGMSFGELIKEVEDNNILKRSKIIPAFSSVQESNTLSLNELVKEAYKEQKPDFYNGAYERQVNITFNDTGISGKLFLEIDEHKHIRNRISQNGIWIKNGHKFIDKIITNIINADNDFLSYDIDISINLFDLSASRDDIVDCDYNRNLANNIANRLLDYIPNLIEKIEYVLVFPCGGRWYEGIRTFLYKLPESDWLLIYQKTLHKLFETFERHEDILESLNRAKLCHIFQKKENTPVSVSEIIQTPNEFMVLLPVFVNSDSGIYGIDNYDSNYEKKKKIDLEKLSEDRMNMFINYIEKSPYKIIFLPEYLQSFIIPLIINFKWSIQEKNQDFIVFNLSLSQEYNKDKNIDFIKKAIKYK